MSVYHRILGSPLPCNVLELLNIQPMPLPGPQHDALVHQSLQRYPDMLYKLGLSHLGRQELGLAHRRLQEAVDVKGEFVRARLALAGVCDLLARHDEAVSHLDAVLSLIKPDSDLRHGVLCAAGFCRERMGDWRGAIDYYHQALILNTGDLFADYRLAAIHMAHNQLEQSVEHHRAILEQQPQEQTVRISLAHLLQLLDKHQEAVWEYEKAFCLEPESWELQVELAEELARMGNTAEAVDHLKQLVERQPQFPDLRLRLANLYSERGEDETAVSEYETALSLHPEYLDCHIALARHELRMGRMEPAMEHFQRAISINDQKVEAYVGLAVALHRLGNAQRAAETLASVERISGNTDVLLSQLGALELRETQTVESTEAAEPSDAQPADVKPEIEKHRQRLERQVTGYATLLDRHPNWTDVRIRQGMLLKMLGRLDEAVEQFERASTDNPGLVEAWVQLGLTRQAQGESSRAMQAFQTAIQLGPEWAQLHYKLGLAYCNPVELELAMEKMESTSDAAGIGNDIQRQLWVAIEEMQMHGRRGAEEHAGRVQLGAKEAA
jgi:tetratricopeptide (TPR) repeat protein